MTVSPNTMSDADRISRLADESPVRMNAADAVLAAVRDLGGEVGIDDVERWIASHSVGTWKDIGTTMADLSYQASRTSGYPAERRFLERVSEGRYRLRPDWTPPGPDVSKGLGNPPATRSRKAFIESHGATCANWTWSWSFINSERRMIIFGAWDMHTEGSRSLILDEAWAVSPTGRRSPAYPQSREHVRLVEEEGYDLFTFPMEHSNALHDADGVGPAKIAGFTPLLTKRSLGRAGTGWYASDDRAPVNIPEQVDATETYVEGAAVTVLVNGYERNERARQACITHHGAICGVCGFDFERYYGPLGRGVIHVHHRIPLADRGTAYVVDPITDLIPVCPNCHAMIHLTRKALEVDAVKAMVAEYGGRE